MMSADFFGLADYRDSYKSLCKTILKCNNE